MATRRKKTTTRRKGSRCLSGVKDGYTAVYKKDLIKEAQEQCKSRDLKISRADIDTCVTAYFDAVKEKLKKGYKEGQKLQVTIPQIATVRVIDTTKVVGRAKDSNGKFKKGSKGKKVADTRISFTTSRYMENAVTGKSLPKKNKTTSSSSSAKSTETKSTNSRNARKNARKNK